jgi:hypothetical protein
LNISTSSRGGGSAWQVNLTVYMLFRIILIPDADALSAF